MGNIVLPAVVIAVILWGVAAKIDILSSFVAGAGKSMSAMVTVFPSLICLMLAVNVFRASGAMDVLCSFLGGITNTFFPKEVLPLALLRPFSGAGALAAFETVLDTCGPDSFAGRVAAVVMGSTETTFYTMALYYGSVGVKKGRHTVPYALTADIVGFLASAAVVALFFGTK